MGNMPLRRFVDLEVDEVSLVDSPANEKEFAILKRVEEEMPNDVKEVIEKEATSSDEKLEEETDNKEVSEKKEEEVSVDPEKIVTEAVEKAIGKVTGLIESIAKKSNEKNEDAPKETVPEKVEEVAPEKTEEAAPEVAETPEVAPEATPVEKAKRFTPTRIQTLKEVAATIQTLVGEIADASQPEEEKEVSKSAEKDETQEVFKSLTQTLGDLKTSFQSFLSTSKTLNDRLEVIEKSIQPSQSVEGNGGTDTDVKKDNNIWKGLL